MKKLTVAVLLASLLVFAAACSTPTATATPTPAVTPTATPAPTPTPEPTAEPTPTKAPAPEAGLPSDLPAFTGEKKEYSNDVFSFSYPATAQLDDTTTAGAIAITAIGSPMEAISVAVGQKQAGTPEFSEENIDAILEGLSSMGEDVTPTYAFTELAGNKAIWINLTFSAEGASSVAMQILMMNTETQTFAITIMNLGGELTTTAMQAAQLLIDTLTLK